MVIVVVSLLSFYLFEYCKLQNMFTTNQAIPDQESLNYRIVVTKLVATTRIIAKKF